MAAAIEIARRGRGRAELRKAAGWAKDGRVARRMPAMEGAERKTAAESRGMERQTLYRSTAMRPRTGLKRRSA